MVVSLDDGCLIRAPVAIIGRRKQSDQLIIVVFLVPVRHELVSSTYHLQTIFLIESFGHVLPEYIPGASG